MKKTISIILAIVTLLVMPFHVTAEVSEQAADGFVDLPEKTLKSTEIRTRKQVD